MADAPLGARERQPSRAFSTYTRITLLSPTVIAATYAAFDLPDASVSSALAVVAVVVLAGQQVWWLTASEVWPGERRHRAGPLAAPHALAVGAVVSLVVMHHGLALARPVYVWALPSAAAIAVLVLAVVRWEREVPRWSAGSGALLGLLVASAVAVAAASGPGGRGSAPDAEATGGEPFVRAAVTAVLVLVATTVLVGQAWWDRVVLELTAARNRVVEQAVIEERLRFAGELHDLQGHQLQVILMRADLARAVLASRGSDGIVTTLGTLDEISDSVRETLRETREIAHGYRRVSFADEARNAGSVLASAGVEVSMSGPLDAFEGEAERVAGLLVREATTNILRHSEANAMELRVTRAAGGPSLTISDPGPPRDTTEGEARSATGSGLASIAERARVVGYRLSAARTGERWCVTLAPQDREDS